MILSLSPDLRLDPLQPTDRVRAELRKVAHDRGVPYDHLLRRYATERMLYRMRTMARSIDPVLHGAWAIEVRLGVQHRRWTTVRLHVDDERKHFDEEAEAAGVVRRYGGPQEDSLDLWWGDVRGVNPVDTLLPWEGSHRVKADIHLDMAVIPFEVVVDFNLHIVPDADEVELDTLLDLPSPSVKVARFEHMVAHRVARMVSEGVLRFSAKDYFDVWLMLNTDPLEGLAEAVEAAFRQWQVQLPDGVPAGLTDRFAASEHAYWHWSVFLDRGEPLEKVGFTDVVAGIRERVMPVFEEFAARGR